MGYKLKATARYDNGIGQELPDAYAWIDTIIVETRAKRANIILKITANKQASLDQKKELETISFIIENKTEKEKEEKQEYSDYTNYIEDLLEDRELNENIKERAYEFIDDNYTGKKIGTWKKDDWQSDEI